MLDAERRSSNDIAAAEESKHEKGGEKKKEWLEGERKLIRADLVQLGRQKQEVESAIAKLAEGELDEVGRQQLERLQAEKERVFAAEKAIKKEAEETAIEWFTIRKDELFEKAIRDLEQSTVIPEHLKKAYEKKWLAASKSERHHLDRVDLLGEYSVQDLKSREEGGRPEIAAAVRLGEELVSALDQAREEAKKDLGGSFSTIPVHTKKGLEQMDYEEYRGGGWKRAVA